MKMALHRSLDEYNIIAALLHDVHTSDGAVFNIVSLNKTLKKVKSRLSSEGISFLTKTLPRLGKAFDKALSGDTPLNASKLRFTAMPGSKLPRFLGELFSEVLQIDGTLLQEPSTNCVRCIRQICYLFYKYELPYTDEQEQQVISKFERTESDLSTVDLRLDQIRTLFNNTTFPWDYRHKAKTPELVVRGAKDLLSRLFAHFDPKDIYPKHGPGAVATKQQLWEKYEWTNVSAKITEVYPLDEYFYASLGHVCDHMDGISDIQDKDLPARVILVPKDSRGPRLISCEPVDYQWVQQGLGRAIVELVENTRLTKFNVFFTDQSPNRIGALYGSATGKYATLDLNEASDRVSADLVRLLFPEDVYTYLMACRSSSTELPDGRVLALRKYAPMGSCLCFPIMALTIWAILTSAAPDAYTRERIHVYGDDVIVPTAYAVNAMEQLESFGLKINRDKSCISGLFRESCGMDAFKGVNVTPVRLRTVWSSTQSPESYQSWIAYSNSFFDRGCFATYDYIVSLLTALYGPIPGEDTHPEYLVDAKETHASVVPLLRRAPAEQRPLPTRSNHRLQKRETKVWVVKTSKVRHVLNGWQMLLRYFSEKANVFNKDRIELSETSYTATDRTNQDLHSPDKDEVEAFSVSTYTRRSASMLVKRWR